MDVSLGVRDDRNFDKFEEAANNLLVQTQKSRAAQFSVVKADYPFSDRFIKEIHNMPDSAGIAFGIDRLVMLFANTDIIDDVVSFIPEEL